MEKCSNLSPRLEGESCRRSQATQNVEDFAVQAAGKALHAVAKIKILFMRVQNVT